jgi:hypothetical protein
MSTAANTPGVDALRESPAAHLVKFEFARLGPKANHMTCVNTGIFRKGDRRPKAPPCAARNIHRPPRDHPAMLPYRFLVDMITPVAAS